jgi:hypothetical protein
MIVRLSLKILKSTVYLRLFKSFLHFFCNKILLFNIQEYNPAGNVFCLL